MSSPRRTLSMGLLAAVVVLIGVVPPAAVRASSQSARPDQSRPNAIQSSTRSEATVGGQHGPYTTLQALQARSTITAGANTPTKEVFGYATSGSLGDPTFGYPTWNFNLLSTVAFFAIHAQYNGVLIADSNFDVWNSSVLTGLVNTAHAHGVKVVVTIVGPGGNDPIDQCDALYNADTTTLQLVNQVVLKGVDGVNIDYEGQLGLCQNNNPALNQTNQALLTNFAKLMRAGLDKARPGYYLSIASYSGSASGTDGFFNIPDLSQYVDSFFVMAYDMDYPNQYYAPLNCPGTHSINCLSPVSPLANYYYNDSLSMAQYSAVAGAGKTILGQPLYGRVACVGSPIAHAVPTSAAVAATYLDSVDVYNSPDVQPGTYATNRGDAYDPAGMDRWDTWYDRRLGCWREMYWGDATQLGARYDLVNRDQLRGVGFWTLNYGGGATELWDALQSHFVTCTNPTATPGPGSPQPLGTQVALTMTSGNCPNPLYEVWVLPPGSTTWQLARTYSSNPVFNWDTASHSAGTYRFSVWALDARSVGLGSNSLGRWDTYTSLTYTLTATTAVPCTSVTTSVTPSPPELAGTQVTLTAAANGCPSPRYQFWMLTSAGWQLVQAYTVNASFHWNTAGDAPGSYLFSVWARDATSFGTGGNSLGTWDAYTAPGIPVFARPCTAVTGSGSPASPQLATTPVTVTGSATGCPSPNYQFWLRAPGSTTWTVAQPYSASATFNWNTSGQPAGPYGVAVWTRDASSLGTYRSSFGSWDALTSFSFTLTSTPCASVSVSSSPPSSAAAGAPVTISATASSCPNPLYQFWIQAPGSSTWQLAQAYSGSASFNWNTTGRPSGVYHLSIWVRDSTSVGTAGNSLGAWDAYAAISYTLT